MEQSAVSEIQPVQLRATQREKIFKDYINTDSRKELFGILSSSDKPMVKTTANRELLKQLAESLGKDTHTVLFSLAATAKNPVELQNILSSIADLKKVKSLYWNHEESENKFLTRKLPDYIGASEETRNEVENALEDRDVEMDDYQYSQHFLELGFYIFSARDVPIEYKRKILEFFYNTEALTSSPLREEDGKVIYGQGSTFWSHVDGSWIDPRLPHAAEKPKKPNRVGEFVRDAISRKGHYEKKSAGLSDEVASLREELDKSNTEISRLRGVLGNKQDELDEALRENQGLRWRLRDAERQAQARTGREQARKSPFEILKIEETATGPEILGAYRRLALSLHPDTIKGKLKNAGVDDEAIDQIGQLANDRFLEINDAYEQLRNMGKVK